MPGHGLWLTDGTTTVQLNDASTAVTEEFAPGSPEMKAGMDWAEMLATTVVDSFPVIVLGSSKAQLQSRVESIEKLLAAGMTRQRLGSGARVFLHLQLDNEGSSWRSEVLGGRVETRPETLQAWGNSKAILRLYVTRRGWWEGAEAEVALSVGGGAAATGGKTIYNHDDSGHDNWTSMASDQVGGALPAGCRLKLINNSGAGRIYWRAWVGVNSGSAVNVVEGEDRLTGYGTVVSAGSYSNGQANERAFTGTGTIRWAISAAQLQAAGGRAFRVIGRLPSYTPGSGRMYAQLALWDESGTVDHPLESDEVMLPSPAVDLVDLGKITLPPSGYGGTWAGATLELRLRATGSSSLTVDYLLLLPTEHLRLLTSRGLSLANGDALVDDGIEEQVYVEEAGSGELFPLLAPAGGPLLLEPGKTQRLIVVHDESSGYSHIDSSLSVRVWVRPRRWTL